MRTPPILPAFGLAVALLLSGACSDSNGPSDTQVASSVLTDVPTQMVASYALVDGTASTLSDALTAFAADSTGLHFVEAKSAWVQARLAWEQIEAFGFGPAETQNLDPSMDSWPVNTADIATILAGSATLDNAYFSTVGESSKGFHAIEYLLYGPNGTKTAADFTARELEFLDGAGQNLAASANTLLLAWDPLNGAYATELATAGQAGSLYATKTAGLQEIVNGMIGVADELANSKMTGPLGPPVDPTLDESAFSDNSINDFQNNILGIKNVYVGQSNGFDYGKGIQRLVKNASAADDQAVLAAIAAAQAAITALGTSYQDAVNTNPTGAQAAIDAVNALRQTLEDVVLPLTDVN